MLFFSPHANYGISKKKKNALSASFLYTRDVVQGNEIAQSVRLVRSQPGPGLVLSISYGPLGQSQ